MDPLSRRRVLGVVAAAAASGCAGTGARETASPSPTVAASEDAAEESYTSCLPDPTTARATHPAGDPVVRSSALTPAWDWTAVEWVVASSSDRDALTYAPAATNVDALRAFVDGTDLSARSLLVLQHRYDACLALRVERVKWRGSARSSGGRFDFGVQFADGEASVDCEGRGDHTITTAVRVPAEVEAVGEVTSATFPIGRDDC
ncbi:hypothetical protein [Candidatus Halobonum tyrrellensis]|uniref:Lipoprotein n=1 Tax=Candidatus Halobonum tyrrellensis G22 TaxID=1324957 RepID=V4HD72_9EURY|nr:hypothetical protein [Candidatus Halobonum tyrrellensis]ESP88665.1 hypothetical protein K933_08118 [Candidatus Halobonum tyrrellensis G22]